jgi:hypothetical protein
MPASPWPDEGKKLLTRRSLLASLPAQQQLHTPSPLLDAHGRLTQAGWARQPLLDCNLENAQFYSLRFLQRFRIKRWDYYAP